MKAILWLSFTILQRSSSNRQHAPKKSKLNQLMQHTLKLLHVLWWQPVLLTL